MKPVNNFSSLGARLKWQVSLGLVLAASLLTAACGGGGGGSAPPSTDAVVKSVVDAQTSEGTGGTSQLEFWVSLDRPSERGVAVYFSTVIPENTGSSNAVPAIGGASCQETGVDFVLENNGQITIPAGSENGKLAVTVCSDAIVESDEILHVRWSSAGSSGGTVTGTILDDDGGGGEPPLTPEAVVQSVSSAQVLEGSLGTSKLEFAVTLDKPVVRGLTVSFSTGSSAKVVGASTGSATGGVCGVAGVDFASATNNELLISPGSSMIKLAVTICPDTDFEPNETLNLSWSSAGAMGATIMGTIINDDAGGLNSTGASVSLGNLPVFGRDANALTNNPADGALGFSFAKQPGCTLDNVTGLSWQRLSVPGQSLNFASLAAYVTAVNDTAPCGFRDWRVPTANELLSLMDASQTTGNPANADVMGNASDVMNARFWSAESLLSANAVDAWQVDARNGGVISYVSKTDLLQVRLVRGAPYSTNCDNSDGRFSDSGDGTIADKKSGLMWKKCPEGYTDAACLVGSANSFSSVSQMLAQLQLTNTSGNGLGYSDWRIPSRNELASLVNRACTSPTIVPSIFPGNGAFSFVTATLNADAPSTQVWSVNFADGSVGPDLLTRKFGLRLVRAGQ